MRLKGTCRLCGSCGSHFFDHYIYLMTFYSFFLKKGICKGIKKITVSKQHFSRTFIGIDHKAFYFIVYFLGCFFTIILMSCYFTPKKYLFFLFTKSERAEFLAHAPLCDHFSREIGRTLKVVSRTRRHMIKSDLLRRPSAH